MTSGTKQWLDRLEDRPLGRTHRQLFPGASPLREVPPAVLKGLGIDANLNVWIKDECALPGSGTSKTRAAFWMLAAAIESGELSPDTEVVEASSGNTAAALAVYCRQLDVPLRIFLPRKTPEKKVSKIRNLGGSVTVVLVKGTSEDARRKVREYARKHSGRILWLNQYDNFANPNAHLVHSAPELWEQTGGSLTHLFSGCGSGATLLGHKLAYGPGVQVIGVEPKAEVHGLSGLKNLAAAAKEKMLPKVAHPGLLDRTVYISDTDGHRAAQVLAEAGGSGYRFGHSTGANLAAVASIANELTPADLIVVYGHDGLDLYTDDIEEDAGKLTGELLCGI